MARLREHELGGFIKQRMAVAIGLLLYGGNETGVQSTVDQVVAAFSQVGDVRRLDANSLRADPALLDEAFRSMSLLGGRELIIVEGVDDNVAKANAGVLASATPGNFVLWIAGSLGKASALRKQAEEAANFYALAIYDPKPGDIMRLVSQQLQVEGLRFAPGAEQAFQQLCGSDVGQALREAEKLALYCRGLESISEEDVFACCGDLGSSDVDGVIDSALSGDFASLDRIYAGLAEVDQKAVAPLLATHLSRLESIRADADRMGGVEAAMRAARPPVFFGREKAFAKQVNALSLEAMLAIHALAEDSAELARRIPGLAGQIGLRNLFAIAGRVRAELR